MFRLKIMRKSTSCWLGTPVDRWLFLGLLALILFAWSALSLPGKEAKGVRIFRDGQFYASYSFPETGKALHVVVPGRLGPAEILITKEGVRFLSSPCPTKRCVHSGVIHLQGQMLACVPNRIALQIAGDAPFLDAVVE